MRPHKRDYFAEMYVAGVLADAGWNIYFPRRDQGFDFIAAKAVGDQLFLRPVQVKGKYPAPLKGDRAVYGYVGRLSQLHPEMVLAIPFFSDRSAAAPRFTAYMPHSQIRQGDTNPTRFRSLPAYFRAGEPGMRLHYRKFFDEFGIALMEKLGWRDEMPERPASV